jgi:DNA repair exonuclease SbcCD ATPase subunit
MTLQEAADELQISKKRLWRAVKAGKVPAERVEIGGKWEYHVTAAAAEAYRSTLEMERDAVPMDRTSGTHHQDTERDANRSTVPLAGTHAAPPLGVYEMMLDRLQRAERRAVELELTLRQQQRLLTENAESIIEKDARAVEARAQLQAVEDAKQSEIERLSSELETTRRQLEEAQRPSGGFFSWLGLRKKRAAGAPADKAV